jgi:general stress protein 26
MTAVDSPSRSDLEGRDAIERIRDTLKRTDTCFFETRIGVGGTDGARPMGVREVDEHGRIWFLSDKDSHKNAEITADPRVTLYFQASEHSGFLRLSGRASLVPVTPELLDRLWSPLLKVWFTEGRDDPRISIIRFDPEAGYYWDNKHGDAVAGIKMLVGAAFGVTLDDGEHGQLRP